MALPIPSVTEIQDRIWNKIRQNTELSVNIDSSSIGLLTKIVAQEYALIWESLRQIAENSQLSTAVGGALDNFGLELGIPRLEARKATTLGSPKAVRFTNTGSVTVLVPSGTRIWNSEAPQLAFFTVEGLSLDPGQSGDVHATAVETGEVYNVGIGQLNRHNAPSVPLTVQNILPIQNGSLRESDAAYRERLLQGFRRRKVVNLSNLNALLRGVPGVKDVLILNKHRGPGTIDCIIIPYNYTATSEIVAECSRLLNESLDAATDSQVRGPVYKQLSVSVSIRFTPSAGDRRELIRESVRQQIRARIDSLPVEDGQGVGSLFTGQLRALAQLADNSVLDATISCLLDGSPLASDGEIRVGIGERIILTALEVN